MPTTVLRRSLARLIGARIAISTLLLGFGILVQLAAPGAFPVSPFFLLIGLAFALAIVHVAMLPFVERWPWLVDLQFGGDALMVSGFIAVTGGVTSYFSLLYVLPIIAASTLRRRRGALIVASLSAVAYTTVVLVQYGELWGVPGFQWPREVQVLLPPAGVAQYTVGTTIFAFLAVGALSGSLAESLGRTGARLERASAELANLQAFNQHVIDSLTSGLVTTDKSGRILTFNRAAELITGHEAAATSGRSVAEVLQLPAELADALARDLDGARVRRADYQYRGAGEHRLDIGLSAAHLITPGGRAGFLFTFQDVTEIRRLERDGRFKQRLAAVGEMAAGIAHEIRNPLASMSGSIQVLRQELPLSDEQSALMDIVLRESERLNDTIRSFLAYARPQRFAIARMDVRRLLNDTALLLRNSSEVREGHLIEVAVPDTEVSYEADEGQIKQIVWNLATNGLRAMPEGGRLRLAAAIEEGEGAVGGNRKDGAEVVIRIADEGVGMTPEDLDGIFQPFHGGFARGSGLGLAIVHRIVSDYNGEIQISSSPGRGTTVSVRLPVRSR